METYVIADGQAHSLTDHETCWLVSDDGLGMAPNHRLRQRGPQQHGETDVGYRLDPRVVQLVLELAGTSPADKYAKRERLLAWFRPRAWPIALRWVLPDGSLRQLDCHYVGDMSLGTKVGDGVYQRVGISVNAPDPTFYDPLPVMVSASTVVPGMAVPAAVPTAIATGAIDVTETVVYAGTVRADPYLIRITGPISGPVIENLTTGEKLDLSGTTIAGGDYYELDLRYGQKTVKDAAGVNRIANLTTDSDLATFHLAADDEVAGGINSLRIYGTGCDAATRVDLAYYTRYVGF
jgi:hypothetical protein